MWVVEQTKPTVTTIRIPIKRNADWEQWALISADRHVDNPKSHLALQRRHLEQAKERGAFVIDLGDLFDAMQGRSDRRAAKCDLHQDHKTNDYLGEIIRSAVDLFTPYADQMAILGLGNHETAILKHMELDLTRQLVDHLQARGSQVVRGGYRGWVRLAFGRRQTLNLCYMHGSGGAAPVTKGVIRTNRRAVVYPDADIVVAGHIHEAWAFPINRVRLSDMGREYKDEQLHLCIPTYKDEIIDQGEGFAVEGEHSPKPLGAWWLRFFWSSEKERVEFEYMRAK